MQGPLIVWRQVIPDSIFHRAASLLARHYGSPAEAGPPGDWTTLVRIVFEPARPGRKARDWSWIVESPLADPRETALLRVDRIAEILEAADLPAVKARSLHALAGWWLRRIGGMASEDTSIWATRSVESWQEELRALPGVNWELSDRILLFVGQRLVYPLDRGSMRIAARHGWMDTSSEYEDWQAFFAAGGREGQLDLAQLSRWHSLVARDFCKAQPHCDTCPLKSLLPERGVISLEECE